METVPIFTVVFKTQVFPHVKSSNLVKNGSNIKHFNWDNLSCNTIPHAHKKCYVAYYKLKKI